MCVCVCVCVCVRERERERERERREREREERERERERAVITHLASPRWRSACMESFRCCRRGRALLPVILMCFPAIANTGQKLNPFVLTAAEVLYNVSSKAGEAQIFKRYERLFIYSVVPCCLEWNPTVGQFDWQGCHYLQIIGQNFHLIFE